MGVGVGLTKKLAEVEQRSLTDLCMKRGIEEEPGLSSLPISASWSDNSSSSSSTAVA